LRCQRFARDDLPVYADATFVIGWLIAIAGCALVAPSLAVIVTGLVLVSAAVTWERNNRDNEPD